MGLRSAEFGASDGGSFVVYAAQILIHDDTVDVARPFEADLLLDYVDQNQCRRALERISIATAAAPLRMNAISTAEAQHGLTRQRGTPSGGSQADFWRRGVTAPQNAPGCSFHAVAARAHLDPVGQIFKVPHQRQAASKLARPLAIGRKTIARDAYRIFGFDDLDGSIRLVGDIGALALHTILVGTPTASDLVETFGQYPGLPIVPNARRSHASIGAARTGETALRHHLRERAPDRVVDAPAAELPGADRSRWQRIEEGPRRCRNLDGSVEARRIGNVRPKQRAQCHIDIVDVHVKKTGDGSAALGRAAGEIDVDAFTGLLYRGAHRDQRIGYPVIVNVVGERPRTLGQGCDPLPGQPLRIVNEFPYQHKIALGSQAGDEPENFGFAEPYCGDAGVQIAKHLVGSSHR